MRPSSILLSLSLLLPLTGTSGLSGQPEVPAGGRPVQIYPNLHPGSPLPQPYPDEAPMHGGNQDLTVTWGDEIQLTDFVAFSDHPRVAIWNDAVHVVWYTAIHAGPNRVMICSSFDRGSTWRRINPVSPWAGTGEPIDDVSPAVAVWGRNLCIAMREHNIPNYYTGIVYSASSDYGWNWWDEPLELFEECNHPSISIWKRYVNVIGLGPDGTIHQISIDGGMSFQPPDTLSTLMGGFHAGKMLAYRNYVFLVYPALWPNTTRLEVFFHRSTDYGFTFSPYLMLSTEDPWPSQVPSMCFTEDGDIYICWMDDKYSVTGDILMRHSPDFGVSWEDEIQVTNNHYAQWNAIAAFDSQVHIVWTDERLGGNEDELYYKNSNDYGWSWSDEVRLTTAHDRSSFPDMAQKGDTLHLVWYDERNTLGSQIYYRCGIVEPQLHICSTNNSEIAAKPQTEMSVHPNPFNLITTFSFTLPVAAKVNFSVFDITGNQVVSTVNGWREAGQHEFIFNASHLSSGVYLYRLEAGKRISIGKMVLMK